LGADGVPRFTDVAPSLGADDDRDGRGIAIADFDNDGDLDIAVNHNPGDTGDRDRARPDLLINEIGDLHQWLAVELIGQGHNRDAIGARVVATSGDLRQLRQIDAGSSYAAQHGQRLYFGLGERTTVDTVEVRWPNGRTVTVSDLAARTLVRITEGGGYEVGALPGSTP
jgi:enediyne biosynthesis protein E4